jgi:hypothetical protein
MCCNSGDRRGFQEGLSPLFAGILEERNRFTSGQSYKNTVSAINDTPPPEPHPWRLCGGEGVKAKAFEKALTLDAGAIANEPMDLSFRMSMLSLPPLSC